VTSIKNAAYARVVQRRADRLGLSVDQAESVSVSKPRYLVAAEKAAVRLGTTPKDVLREDLRRLENSTYPSPDCITPDDVEDLTEVLHAKSLSIEDVFRPEGRELMGPMWSKKLSHLTSCDPCQTLLIASQPNQKLADQFAQFVGHLYSPAAAKA
jgi:hypothetical protein